MKEKDMDSPPPYEPSGYQSHAPPSQTQVPGPAVGTSSRNASNREDPLAALKRFDTVFLVDDSASMQKEGRWEDMKAALKGVAEQVVMYDADGIDIYFLNSKECWRNARSARDVESVISRVRPIGANTPTEVRVEELLGTYLDQLERNKAQGLPPLKPLNLIILTDGRADDPDTLAYALSNFCVRLDEGRFPLTQLGVQFVQVGSDREAAEALRELDDELKGNDGVKRDIVDTTPYQGRVNSDFILKVLLGGVNRRFDRN